LLRTAFGETFSDQFVDKMMGKLISGLRPNPYEVLEECAIFEDLLTGTLKREQVRGRIQSYIAAHNRMYPTKFAKFGDSALVSLDEVLFDSGTTTRGDSVSRGLWD
jgi:hypothetical protein